MPGAKKKTGSRNTTYVEAEEEKPHAHAKARPMDGSSVVELAQRPMDAWYALLYLVLFAGAVAAVAAPGCGRLLPAQLAGACPPAVEPKGAPGAAGTSILSGLWHQWQTHTLAAVGKASPVGLFLLRAEVAANLVLAPCLSYIMLVGVERSAWQVPAIVHITVMALVSAAFATAAKPPQTQAGQAVSTFFLAVPIVLLRRWWVEWPFSMRTMKPKPTRSRLWRLWNLLFSAGVVVGTVYCGCAVYEWAIAAHQDLSGLPPVAPYVDAAVGAAQGAVDACQDAAGEAWKGGAPVVQKYASDGFEQASSALADLGGAVMQQFDQLTKTGGAASGAAKAGVGGA